MAMRPCQKCGNNNWRYGFRDATGEVTATCRCGHVVSFLSKRQKKLNAGIPVGGKVKGEGVTMNGQVYRREKDGILYPVEAVFVKGGLKLISAGYKFLRTY